MLLHIHAQTSAADELIYTHWRHCILALSHRSFLTRLYPTDSLGKWLLIHAIPFDNPCYSKRLHVNKQDTQCCRKLTWSWEFKTVTSKPWSFAINFVGGVECVGCVDGCGGSVCVYACVHVCCFQFRRFNPPLTRYPPCVTWWRTFWFAVVKRACCWIN